VMTSGKADITARVSTNVTAEAHLSMEAMSMKLEAGLAASVEATAHGHAEYGGATVSADVKARVGAFAVAQASLMLNKDGLDVVALLACGVKASIDAKFDFSLGPFTFRVVGEASVGAYVEVGGTIKGKWEGSEFKFHVTVNAGVGGGASLGVEVVFVCPFVGDIDLTHGLPDASTAMSAVEAAKADAKAKLQEMSQEMEDKWLTWVCAVCPEQAQIFESWKSINWFGAVVPGNSKAASSTSTATASSSSSSSSSRTTTKLHTSAAAHSDDCHLSEIPSERTTLDADRHRSPAPGKFSL